MPDATITSTASTFGTIAGTFAADQSTITGTITAITGTVDGSVGVPGPQGPAGAAGVGVPAAGTTGQVLQKLSATSYDTGWLTLPADYITSVTAPLAVASGNLSVNLSAYLPLAGGYITGDIQSNNGSGYRSWNGTNLTGIFTAGSIVFNDTTPGHGSLTLDADGLTFHSSPYKQTTPFLGLAGYATEAWVTNGFYPLAGNPSGFLTDAPSNGSQYARKNAAWDVVIPGDRYLTTSTTSNTINNANKTFTIGTGLSYTPTQNITISYDASNHMHGEVLTYNSGTGVLTVDVNHHTGSGTYTAWVVNVGGVTPATSVAWGAITGTLSTQTDLQNALDLKLDVTTAASTYYLQTNPSGFIDASALTPYAPLAGATFTGKVNMAAPTAGSASLNLGVGTAPTTSVAGDIWIATNINYKDSAGTQKAVANTNTANTFSQPQVISNSGTATALRITQTGTGEAFRVEDSTTPDATRFVVDQFGKVGIGVAPDTTAALKVDNNGIMFGDGTTQTTAATAGIPDAPSDGSTYGRNNGAWAVAGGGGANIQTFTTAGTATWTKPSGKTMAWVRVWGAGSGGGSGARQATTVARSGGGGGGPGGFVEAFIPVALLGATETVTVGAGGAGGASIAVNSTNGSNGSPGGDSTFSIFRGAGNNSANGGGTGGASTAVTGATTASSYVTIGFSTSATASNAGAGNITTGGTPTSIAQAIYSLATSAGGGGGAAAASVITANGGSGAGKQAAAANSAISGLVTAVAGGTAGNATTQTAPTTGTSGVARYQGGTGGGGGGYKTATAGQAGAAGAQPGGGGGGGGASDNLFASGAGGAGGAGMVIVVSY